MAEDGRPVGQAVGLGRMAGNGVENCPSIVLACARLGKLDGEGDPVQ